MSEESMSSGMYFEDFEVGQTFKSVARTVTETDVVMFSGVSGDFNPLHTDAEFAGKTPFGQRIAHGLLGLSIASGLIARTGILDGTVMAFREVESWKFSKPILFGDTIHVRLEVSSLKAMRRLGGGLVKINVHVVNQNGDKTQTGVWSVLMKSRDAE